MTLFVDQVGALIPSARWERVGARQIHLYLPNGWTISVLWGHSDILAPDGTADVMAFKGPSPLDAEQTRIPEDPLSFTEMVDFIGEVSRTPG